DGPARDNDSSSATVAGRPVRLAQLYEPGEEIYHDRRVRVFIDQYGRRITMDRRGRILSVEDANNYDPNAYDRRVRRAPQPDSNWTLDGPGDGGAPYDGFGNVPEDPNYYPDAPAAPQYGGNRDGQVQRLELPPAGDQSPDNTNTNSARANPGSDDQQNDGQPGYEQPRGVPNPSDMAPAIEMPKGQGAKAKIAAYQILLDRAGASPGVIDGRSGSNVDKAAAAYGELTGKSINPTDEAAVNAELEATGGPAFTEYTITNEDVGRQY